MFRGINTISLDNKGRIAVPAKYREIFENKSLQKTKQLLEGQAKLEDLQYEQLIVTIDPEDRCLLMYPLHNWEEIEQKISMLPSFNFAARRIQRLLIGHATEVGLDNQGRILLPQELREYASLNKKAVLVGQGRKIEIWDLEYWNTKRDLWLEKNINLDKDLPIDLQIFSL